MFDEYFVASTTSSPVVPEFEAYEIIKMTNFQVGRADVLIEEI